MSIYYIDENGQKRDKGLVDGMLENEDKITEQLIEKGIIRKVKLRNLSDLPQELQDRYAQMVRDRTWVPENEEAQKLEAEMNAVYWLKETMEEAGLPWD